jgi:hypothetical protein
MLLLGCGDIAVAAPVDDFGNARYAFDFPLLVSISSEMDEDAQADALDAMVHINAIAGRALFKLSSQARIHLVYGETGGHAAWTHGDLATDVLCATNATEWAGMEARGMGEAMWFHELMHVLLYRGVTGDQHDEHSSVMEAAPEEFIVTARHTAYLQYLGE